MYGTIKGISLVHAAQAVAEQADPQHMPTISKSEVMRLWFVLPDGAICQIADATTKQINAFYKDALTQRYVTQGSTYRKRLEAMIADGYDDYALYYNFNELLQEKCVLALYRSQEDAKKQRNAIFHRILRTRKRPLSIPKPVVLVENPVTVEQLPVLCAECGFTLYQKAQSKGTGMKYYGIRRKTETTPFDMRYLGSLTRFRSMTPQDVRDILLAPKEAKKTA